MRFQGVLLNSINRSLSLFLRVEDREEEITNILTIIEFLWEYVMM